MTRAALLLLTASGLLLATSSARARSSIEVGQGDAFALPSFSLETLQDRIDTMINTVTEQPADVPPELADANVSAFLQAVQWCEGTMGQPDPYRVCYGYSHVIKDLL